MFKPATSKSYDNDDDLYYGTYGWTKSKPVTSRVVYHDDKTLPTFNTLVQSFYNTLLDEISAHLHVNAYTLFYHLNVTPKILKELAELETEQEQIDQLKFLTGIDNQLVEVLTDYLIGVACLDDLNMFMPNVCCNYLMEYLYLTEDEILKIAKLDGNIDKQILLLEAMTKRSWEELVDKSKEYENKMNALLETSPAFIQSSINV